MSHILGPPDLEEFLRDFISYNKYDVKSEEPDGKRLSQAIVGYERAKSMLFMGPQGELAPSNLRTAIAATKASGAISEKSNITPFEEIMQDFNKWFTENKHKYQQQEQPQPSTEGNNNNSAPPPTPPNTTTANKSVTLNYDILEEQVDQAKNIPPEKKSALKQLLDYGKKASQLTKDYSPIIAAILGQAVGEFVRDYLNSN